MNYKKIGAFFAVFGIIAANFVPTHSAEAADVTLTATATSQNIVLNGNLDTPAPGQPARPDHWQSNKWGKTSASFAYPVKGVTGQAAKVTVTSRSSGDAKWVFDRVAVTPGEKLVYSNSYLANVPSQVTVEYQKQDNSLEYLWLGNVAASTSWKTYQKELTVPANVKAMTVFHLLARVGSLTIDNVSLLRTTVITPPPASTLPANGDFEIASADPARPQGWNSGSWGSLTANFTYPVPGQSGHGARVQVSGWTSGDAKWWFDPIATSAGKVYTFSDQYIGTVPTNVTIEYHLNDGTFQYAWLGDAATSATWATFSTQFTVPANVASFTVLHTLVSNGTLTVDNYRVRELDPAAEAFAQGMITLAYDDGFSSIYQNAIPQLNAAGFKSTQNITTSFVGTPTYMTWSQVNTMKTSGHEIAAHTRTHADLTTLSTAQAWNEIRGSKDDLVARGHTPTTFVYPFGAFNAAIKQQVKDAGFIGARSVFAGFNTRSSDKFELRDQHIESTTTIADVQGWINTAKANKSWLILELHEQNNSGDQYSNTPAMMQSIINAIQASAIPVVTMQQGINQMAP